MPALLVSRTTLLSRWLPRACRGGVSRPRLSLPAERCHLLLCQRALTTTTHSIDTSADAVTFASTAASHGALSTLLTDERRPVLAVPKDAIPLMCPGCGAPSQTVDKGAAGYYGRSKTQRPDKVMKKQSDEDRIFEAALGRGDLKQSEHSAAPTTETRDPICDRCHQLLHENAGESIVHPSVATIREMIEESPHRYNHIYHVIDAVDFPMSLIPNLVSALRLPRMRTKNRRSKHVNFIRGRVAEVSFIITRADLLAPKKEQVDSLLPYMREVLREALGRTGKDVRLGNVRLVSSKRGWWTPTLKEEIFRRGGAGWMVGKVNVGKSSLMEVVFPKGRIPQLNPLSPKDRYVPTIIDADPEPETHEAISVQPEEPRLKQSPLDDLLGAETEPAVSGLQALEDAAGVPGQSTSTKDVEEDPVEEYKFDESEYALLPPQRKEEAYPAMPIVSALPGTTASPIRLPYGNGRGELIDLPGVDRSLLADHVSPEQHKQMIMQDRIVPEQQVVRPGQSLLLGGLIRITPLTEDLIILMYAFVPRAFKPHLTNTIKAMEVQTGVTEDGAAYTGNLESIATDVAKTKIKSAGVFQLRWDVTKKRTGPLTDKVAGKMKPENLPFMVHAMDLVIEGVGWVEIAAQVRRPRNDAFGQQSLVLPEVEVYSPDGKFVTARKPMNAWTLGKPPKGSGRKRPRQTISYKRRMEGGKRGSSLSSTKD